MISSLDGKAAIYGKAGSIGSPTDRFLMHSLRARADAVMVGAGTLRAEKLTLGVPEGLARVRASRGLKFQPLAIVTTVTGELPLRENLLGSSPDNLVVLASSETPRHRLSMLSSEASVEIVPQGKALAPGLDLTSALETLKERYSVDLLLVEGGPALNHALITLSLVDELFLTLAPKLLGGAQSSTTILEGPNILPQKSLKAEPISIYLSEGGELFLRYALHPLAPTQRI